MPNKQQAEDAFLSAKAQVERWRQDFMLEWYGPTMDTAARAMWAQQPEQVKAELRKSAPEATAYLDKLIENSRR
jgi:hypothetical protein